MSVSRLFQISCDAPECFRAYDSSFEQIGDLRAVRRGARAAGWVRRRSPHGGMNDFCPEHKGSGR